MKFALVLARMRRSSQRRLSQIAPDLVGDGLHDVEDPDAFLLPGLRAQAPDERRGLQRAAGLVDAFGLLIDTISDCAKRQRYARRGDQASADLVRNVKVALARRIAAEVRS